MIKKLTLLSNSSILIWTGITREGQILEKEKIKKIKNKLITHNLKIFNRLLKKHMKNFPNLIGTLRKLENL